MTFKPETASSNVAPVAATIRPVFRGWWLALGVACLALLVSVLLWQKLSRIQEQLARQSADAGQPFAKDVAAAYNSPEFKAYAAKRFVGYKYPEGWQGQSASN